eukprot:SAG31_NODE_9582_length_1256_cov_1.101988_1_plen_150_part_00
MLLHNCGQMRINPSVKPRVYATYVWNQVLSSFLISNLNASGTTLVCTQCYGFGGANFSWWPEDEIDVGRALGPPSHSNGAVWSRSYEHALVYCNPGDEVQNAKGLSPPAEVELPAGRTYREALGQTDLLTGNGTTLTLTTNRSAILVWS